MNCFIRVQQWIQLTQVFVPLRGVDCFKILGFYVFFGGSFRPLAGCELFRSKLDYSKLYLRVFVPLRGVDCFDRYEDDLLCKSFSSPCGVWIVSSEMQDKNYPDYVFVPLRGVNRFLGDLGANSVTSEFSSPCGVWIVSVYQCRRG